MSGWADDAYCKGRPRAIFYPEDRGFAAGSPEWQYECDQVAKRNCNLCPVKAECLAFALSPAERDVSRGVWGGVDFLTRRKMIKEMKADGVQAAAN